MNVRRALWSGIDSPGLYDNFELSKVAEYPAGEGTCCEALLDGEELPEGATRVFWTVYGHLPEGGVRALIDFDEEEDAIKHYEFFMELLKGRYRSMEGK